jgi:hypothetical protein
VLSIFLSSIVPNGQFNPLYSAWLEMYYVVCLLCHFFLMYTHHISIRSHCKKQAAARYHHYFTIYYIICTSSGRTNVRKLQLAARSNILKAAIRTSNHQAPIRWYHHVGHSHVFGHGTVFARAPAPHRVRSSSISTSISHITT